MSKLAALLGGMTINELAREVLQLQGRRGDTELAHVNKREAALLKDAGGSGTINPSTGMPEFYDEYSADFGDIGPSYEQAYGGQAAPAFSETGAFDQYGVGQPTPIESQTGAFDQYGVGQPTPPSFQIGDATPPQENLGFDIGFGEGRYTPEYTAADTRGMSARDLEQVVPGVQGVEQGTFDNLLGRAGDFLNKEKTQRALIAGALSTPGLMAARRARRDAASTKAEIERLAAPIRQEGEAQLAAGQRGELTASQQQQVAAAQAAAKQDLARRGQTSGTAAQQAQNRITELAQRFVQTNIDNGVRLIGAANSYNAQAIQQAYRMNQDANTMTQAYFTNLMRAYGAIPTPSATPTPTA